MIQKLGKSIGRHEWSLNRFVFHKFLILGMHPTVSYCIVTSVFERAQILSVDFIEWDTLIGSFALALYLSNFMTTVLCSGFG